MCRLTLFFIFPGTRLERAQKSLRNMGPAVLKGGFSTFLSFILLANSNSHVFETFFKVISSQYYISTFFYKKRG